MNSPTALDRLGWAMRAPIDDATTWRALLLLVNHADATGLAWPKIDTLAAEIRRGERQTRNALDTLEAEGYIERVRVRLGGRLRGYLYRVMVPGCVAMDPDLLPAFAAGVDLPEGWRRPVTSGGAPPVDDVGAGAPTGDVPPDPSGDVPPVDQRRPAAGQEPPKDEPPKGEPETPSPPAGGNGDDPERGFEEWWQQMPRRNGKRVGKKAAREKWRRLTLAQRRDAWKAAVNYAAAVDRGLTIAKDPERFLKAGYYEDWLEPAEPSSNGRPTRAQAERSGYHDVFTRMAAREGAR